jgi:peptidoglycan/xylan/chitin deacetylase (PgdA/CDA1 family)
LKLTSLTLRVALACAVSLPTLYSQQVAFTFDDLPSHGDLPPGETRLGVIESILGTLHEQHIPPVYGFVNGFRLDQDPATIEVLKAWRKAGEPLGSHTYSHLSLNEHTAAEYEANITKDEPLLSSLMVGEDWHWFRYPFLWEGDTLEKRHAIRGYLEQHGYKIARVSMDFEDYLWNAPYARCSAKQDVKSIEYLRKSYLETADNYITVFREATHTLYGRDIPYILLMHVGAFDAKMLPELIDLFRRRGFTFTTLPEASRDPVYSEVPDVPFKYDGTIQEQVMEARKLATPASSAKFPVNTKPYKELEAICR